MYISNPTGGFLATIISKGEFHFNADRSITNQSFTSLFRMPSSAWLVFWIARGFSSSAFRQLADSSAPGRSAFGTRTGKGDDLKTNLRENLDEGSVFNNKREI